MTLILEVKKIEIQKVRNLLERPKILLIEDHSENIEIFNNILKDFELDFIVAATEEEAVQLCDQHDFALVMLNLQLDEMDGYEVAENLRSREKTAQLPIILTSAPDSKYIQVFNGIEKASVSLLPMEFEPAELKEKVFFFIEKHRQLQLSEQTILIQKQYLEALDQVAIVSTTDAKGNITYANKKFCEISGYSQNELIGRNHRILKSGKQPEGLFKGMWAAISMGKTWVGEICNRAKDGSYYWVMTTIVPFLDQKGKIEKFIGIRFEITKIKEYEQELRQRSNQLKIINTQLEFSNKELETFSYSVSHDLKAPLRALQGFSKNLILKYGDQLDDTGNRWLEFIRSNAERMDLLISDILTFSRINRAELHKQEEVDMKDIVENVFNREKEALNTKIDLKLDDLPRSPCDPKMIEMVWQNLIGNALKYSSKNDLIRIDISGFPNKTHNHYIIKDNGVGFDMRHYDKLFGIFQRLHSNEEFEGTGVGLSNVNRILDKHGGKIWAESELGKGSIFEFTLPKSGNI